MLEAQRGPTDWTWPLKTSSDGCENIHNTATATIVIEWMQNFTINANQVKTEVSFGVKPPTIMVWYLIATWEMIHILQWTEVRKLITKESSVYI